jgi:hypothetical protein
MTDLNDLARRIDRVSYDLAKSLVKLDIAQKNELPVGSAVAETKKYLADLRILAGQVERWEVLADERKDVAET